MDVIVLIVIITALVFDFTNAFHCTANAMATSIATGTLSQGVRYGLSSRDVEELLAERGIQVDHVTVSGECSGSTAPPGGLRSGAESIET